VTRLEALAMVDHCRTHAEAKRKRGDLAYTSADPNCPTHLWLAALMEELGEVARCVHDNDLDSLAFELAQLAGVAVGKMETL
jgi:NTP pyrophosphatase (non-canonical NTP hydrolase)